MIETLNPEINVNELMARIRAEAVQLPLTESVNVPESSGPISVSGRFALPRYPEPLLLEPKAAYTLADFLNFHDTVFIRQAYRGILSREPDANGLQNYLERLRAGHITKVEILGRLRYSPEGRIKAMQVRGLLLPFIVASIGRLPVIGYLWRWLIGILRLPILIRNFEHFENNTAYRFDQNRQLFNQGMADCERVLTELQRAKPGPPPTHANHNN